MMKKNLGFGEPFANFPSKTFNSASGGVHRNAVLSSIFADFRLASPTRLLHSLLKLWAELA
jgi:hypothetical protein